jgi:hypothetical protein
MIYKNKIKYFLICFLLLLFSTTFILNNINKNREIFLEPDDFYHYLIKSSNLKHCKNVNCYEENLYKKRDKLSEKELWSHNRQIHRLILSYHPLYTFVLDKISNKDNIFEMQKHLHFFLSLISALLILFYLNYFLEKKHLIVVTLIIASHYFLNNWGLKYPIAWSVSAIISSLAIFIQFKNKYISSILYLISVLMHPIGLVLTFLGYTTYFFKKIYYEFKLKINIKLYLDLFFYGIILFVIFLIGFFTKLSVFDLSNMHSLNVYSNQEGPNFIYKGIYDNFKMFFTRGVKTIILLNPILFVFFILSFFLKKTEEYNILKIFTLILIFSYIFFIIPGQGGSVFTIGKRTWVILIINYVILSYVALISLSKINIFAKYVKNLFFISLPFFILINISYNIHPLQSITDYHNNYYDTKNIAKFKNLIDKNINDKIYFHSSEKLFYFYLISGYIQNNFYFKYSYPNDETVKNSRYVIIDNPITSLFRESSDIIIKDNSRFIYKNETNNYEMIIYSKLNTKIKINNQTVSLNKGRNRIKFFKKVLDFQNIKTPMRIIGLVINDNQNSYWPWYTNIKFDIEYQKKIRSQKLFFKNFQKKITRSYNFNDMSNKILQVFPDCKKEILSDVDSSIILLNNCN